MISTSPQETTYRARRVAADWINKGEKPENVRIVTRNSIDTEWVMDAEETAKIAGLATKRAERKAEKKDTPVTPTKALTLDVALRNLEKTCKLLKSVNALTPRDTKALKKAMGDVSHLIDAIEEAAAREAAEEGAAREKTSTEAAAREK